MAQLDASIILGGRPAQIESPVNALAKVLQVQGMQQQGQMRDLQMQDAMEARTSKNKLAELYRSAVGADGKIDRNRLFQGAAQQGMGAQIPALQKQFAEADEQTGKVDAAAFKLANDRYGAMKQTMGALYQRQDLTKDLVLQAGQELVQAGILKPEMYEKAIATMPDDPMQLRARLRDGLASQMKPEDILTAFAPKPEKIDNGQTIGFRDVNPNSPTYGQNTGGAAVQKQQTPDSIATNATSRANNANTVSAAREANAIMRDLNAQEKRLKIDELQSEQTTRNQAKEAAKVAADVQISAIDKAINHPGRSTGTGFSSMADPRNFVPGTDATDFRVVLDQIKGTAFLQAFQSLKGGGAITEMEGKKAEAAIARLDRAQSDKEFETALKDLRAVMVAGKNRLAGGTGGASSSFDSPPAPAAQGGVIDFGSLK